MSGPPRLRSDLVIVEQTYRGEQSYVVKDPSTHKYFRFRPVEALVLRQFDGDQTPADVAAALRRQGLPFGVPAVEAFARKLGQLGLFERSVAEKSVLQLERLRAARRRRIRRTHYQGSLLRMRWSLPDPDGFFDRWMPRVRFCFTPAFLALSVALFAVYGVICAAHWPQISAALTGLYTPSTYTVRTVILFWLTSVTIISIHELGHGFTCKYFGGQVHEMGAMLIYFEPAFFCNVNDAWTFPDLGPRLWVTAAGSWIQVVMAALGAIVWWAAEPGTVASQVGMFAILIGGITTVLANANPLIPLDGYYALCDWLEVPNLRQRALGYVAWLIKRHVVRLQVPAPPADERERHVFAVYGALSLLYSVVILYIAAGWVFGWISRTLGAIGVLLFAVALWAMLRGAIREWARAVASSVREHRDRWRARPWPRWSGGLLLAALLVAVLVPWPLTVDGRFVVAPVMTASLIAPEESAIERVYATEGSLVPAGAPVVRLQSLDLQSAALEYQRLADSLDNRAAVARAAGRIGEAARLEEAQAEDRALLEGTRARLTALVLRAPVSGVVTTPYLEGAVGRWVDTGTVVAQVAATDSVEVRVTLDPAGATLVRTGQTARLISYADPERTTSAAVRSVSVAAGVPSGETVTAPPVAARDAASVEARIRLPASSGWRAGITGEAKIVVRRTNALGALWWAIRKRIRSDLLL